MKLFRRIRIYISNYLLKRYAKKHPRYIDAINIKQAETVGILYDASVNKSLSVVKELVNHLIKSGKKVKTLGLIDGKKGDDVLIGDKLYNFASLKAFNFFYMPKSEEVKDFIEIPFDLLIVAYPKRFQPINTVSAMSAAKFKVGRSSINEECDFLLDTQSVDMKYFIEQVFHYLTIINNQN